MRKAMGTNSADGLCGAKTRAGRACKRFAGPNGRCRMHGGRSTGPKTAQGRARTGLNASGHGLYSRRLRPEDLPLLEAAGRMEGLDAEIAVVRMKICKFLALQRQVDQDPLNKNHLAGFELSEVEEKEGSGTGGESGGWERTEKKAVGKRPDYNAVLDRFLGRLGHLLKTKHELEGGGGSLTPEEFAQRARSALLEAEGLVDDKEQPAGPAAEEDGEESPSGDEEG